MTALFIGRFQPFHLGHLSVIKQAIQENDFLVIGIGSAEQNFLPDNPFAAGERFEMIKATLDEARISPKKYAIIPVRNINNYQLWVHHVAQIVPAFDRVYTGSKIIRALFETANRKSTGKKYVIKPVKFTHQISGTDLRAMMLKPVISGSDRKSNTPTSWKPHVPPAVARYLQKIDGVKRLKTIIKALSK